MKKPTFSRIALTVLLLFISIQSFSQNLVPFSPRYDEAIKGDMLLIGNSNVGLHVSNPYNGNNTNDNANAAVYVDIDGDPSTFNSSSADLEVPSAESCYQIVYAGLYWSAVVNGADPIANIKFKVPGGTYNDITGTEIYYQNASSNNNSNTYAYYQDVTDIVSALPNPEGTYTVANISSLVGPKPNSEGLSAGWSLFVIYEDPLLSSKYITSFDGFTKITSTINETFPVSGFNTIPVGPVRATYAFSTIEGDRQYTGDYLRINGTTISATNNAGTVIRPGNNFFNSTVSIIDPATNAPELFSAKNPNSSNTLGFDAGIINIPNPGNTLIPNGATSASISLGSNLDIYYFYFNAFAIEIIAPDIVLTKIVEDDLGNDIGGQTVGLGESINYVIGFQNTGNDDATNFTIRDILPINIVFNYPTDLVLPAGVTVASYNPVTREIVFNIADYLVEENDPVYEIRIEVMTVETCNQLADACSNIINNQAFATYQGTINAGFVITDDPSLSSNTGCLLTPQATNFLADLDDCTFSQNEILCGASLELTAADGYDSYSWSTSPTGTPVIGTTQTITVTDTGTYYVNNTATAPCQSIVQEFIVTTFGGDITNPVIPFADEVVTCPNDGKLLPNIFLCGANDFRDIQTNIAGATSIIWEQLDESSCTAVSNPDCANEDDACVWNQVGTGPNYIANTSGQFRLTINFSGGCFVQFYFNVYQNLLNPTVTATDIICTTPGSITVGGVPSGYEYSLDDINYQTSNVFSITTPGIYTVYIRQIGVTSNPCVFTVPDIQIRDRDFTVSTGITQPFCNGDKGSIQLAANDVEPQYFFSLYNGATLVNSVGPITENNYTFDNLNPGTYTAIVETEDGCIYTEDITIIEPPLLTVTAALTSPLSCTDGEITVYPVGGTSPYYYFVNSTTDFQSVPEIIVTAPGVYDITVIDSNNCSASTSITIDIVPAPEFNITTTDILCADSGDAGTLTINVTNANGNSLQYSIDGGTTFFNSPVFTGLAAGDYNVVIEYTIGSSVCITEPQTVTITANSAISGTAELTTSYTCITDGTITVTGVTGGTSPFSYSIDGVTFQTGNIFSGLINGTYTITIQDANDCTFITNEITIDPLDPPTDLTFISSPLTCPTNNSTVTITGTTGGFGTLEYQIIAPATSATPYQTSNVFAGLAPGTYTFQVKDANDCIYSESYTIAPLPTLIVEGQNINDVPCFGGSDGSVQFIVSGSSTFNYTINGDTPISGTSPIVLTGLTAGNYTIVVTDTVTNCEVTDSLIVNEPSTPLSIATTISPITCIENGSVVINTAGGWGGNTFSLTLPDGTVLPEQTNNTFVNLSQDGTYTATVVDTNGCEVTTTFNLNIPNIPIASVSTSSDFCYDATNGATLEVNVTSGQSPYEYSINGGAFQASNIFANLIPGTYTITVRDAYGCELILSSETIEPQITLNTILTKDLDCTASPDAIITGTISGGYAPFTYSVSVDGGAYTSLGATGSPFTYTTGAIGTYQFQVTDAQGCTAQSGVQTINAISLPEILSVTQIESVLCNGDTNAAIEITINNTVGTPAFVINVNNDTTGTDYGTQTTGLPAGTYTITLTDANACIDTETIIINEPDPILVNYHTVDISCNASGISQGSIIIDDVTGGTAPYNYFVTGTNGYSNSELNTTGTTSVSFDVVDFGLYQINVVDSNGCSILFQDVLVASPPTDLDIVITSTVDCLTGGEAVVSVGSTLSSAGPFFFSIYQGPISVYPLPAGSWLPEDSPGSQSATFTGLIPGLLYTFIVYDASTNCSYYEPATAPIPTNSTLTATAVSSNNITCNGNADGNVSFTVNSVYGASVDVSYEIFDSLTLATTGVSGSGTIAAAGSLVISDLGPLPFGNYYVLINETSGPNSGCSIVTVPFNITESAIPLNLSVSIDQNANCNTNSGVITAIGHNGTAPYQYQITTTVTTPLVSDPAWASESIFNIDAGNYYVHVLDAYGCIVSSPVTIVPMDPTPVISAILSNQCTANEGAFEIDVTLPTAGIAPYSFSIDGGAFQIQTVPFTIPNLSSGIHTVEVKDANGCGNLVSVTSVPPLGLTPAITALPTCNDDDGEITISGTGGSGAYDYAISPNPASITLAGNVFSNVPSGTYTITLTDTTTSCTENVTVTLDAATPVTFTTTVTDVSCAGNSNGNIIVNLPSSNDNPIYTYEIIAPITVASQTSNIFTGLPAGTYTIQVNSGRGCSATSDVTITEPVLLEATATATDFACAIDNSVNTATVTITELGGTAPYTYSINGVNYFTTNTFDIIDTSVIQNITVFVKDTNGCIATNTITINPLPTLTAATVAIVTPVDCNNTGSVSITVSGGSGNFTYQMLPDGTPQTSNIFNITTPGDYYFQVNDLDTGCTIATAPFTITPFDTIEAIATATSAVSCFGDSTGEIELNITGYTGNYTYEILDSSGATVGSIIATNTTINPQPISGLTVGNYTVAVTETESPFCSTISNVITITSPISPLALVASETSNVTCTDNLGTISAIGSGGTAPYEYELTGAATVGYSSNGTFTNLSAGVYTVTVRDAEQCITSSNVTLDIPTPIDATFTPNTTLLSCFGDQTATITVSNVTGGQGSNYTYTLNMDTPTSSESGPQISNIFTDLGVGTYTITITDGYSCEFTSLPITIAQPTQIQASLVTETTQTCLTESTLTLSASGGSGPYTYSNSIDFSTVLGSFATATTFSVPVGTYVYYVRDTNGCIANISNDITIDPLLPLELDLVSANPTINCAGDNTGIITATAQGGLGNYIYTLEDTLGNPIPTAVQNSPGIFTELVAGTYVVNVDSGDCNATSSTITITEPTAPLTVLFTATDVTCSGNNDGVLEINASGGTGIIKYAISPQLNQFFETNIFENLAQGTYDVIVQDELGCYETFSFTINEPIPVILSIVADSIFPEVCSGDLDGEFSIDISGGSTPYSVSLDDYNGTYTIGNLGQTQFDFTGLSGGDHIVYIIDNQGCESEWNITFPESVNINPIVSIEYLCVNNVASNIVTVTVDDSITDLTDLNYSLDGGPFQASNIFTDVVPGTNHYIDVTHPNTCTQTTDFFDIIQATPLTLELNEGGLNEYIAIAAGGSGDYEYTLNNENYGTTNTFIITYSGNYTITVTDSSGCRASVSLYLEFIDLCVPNYFTPNNDGITDGWTPGCAENYPNLDFDIFDRYGRKIATLTIGEYWDGKYNDKELPTGDYWYVVRLNDSENDRNFVGHFTLYR